MKIVDTNILLYAVSRDLPQHDRVRAWWESAINGPETIGLPWSVLLGFVRISTNSRIFANPLSVESALTEVDTWVTHPMTQVVLEGAEHWEILRNLLAGTGAAANLTTDAHLAALAIENGATLVSCDLDFARYPLLRWQNPLSL